MVNILQPAPVSSQPNVSEVAPTDTVGLHTVTMATTIVYLVSSNLAGNTFSREKRRSNWAGKGLLGSVPATINILYPEINASDIE